MLQMTLLRRRFDVLAPAKNALPMPMLGGSFWASCWNMLRQLHRFLQIWASSCAVLGAACNTT